MPLHTNELNRKEAAFVAAFAKHGDVAKAETDAGFSKGYGYALVRKPKIMDAVREALDARMLDLANRGSEYMARALAGTLPAADQATVTMSHRIKIWEIALKHGYVDKRPPEAGEAPTIPYEQLSGIIDKLKAKEAELAQDMVDVTPAADDVGDLFG